MLRSDKKQLLQSSGEVILIEQAGFNEIRAASKKRLGMFVVALIVVVLLALGYYYTEAPDEGVDTALVAVRGYLSVEQKNALARQINAYTPESEDSAVVLEIFEFPAAGSSAGSEETTRLFGELLNQIKVGSADLVLLDRYVFDMLGDERLFEDLSEKYPGDPAVSGKYLYAVSGKPFLDAAGLEQLPEVYLALRSSKSSAVNKNATTLEKYTFNSALLDRIVTNSPSADFN